MTQAPAGNWKAEVRCGCSRGVSHFQDPFTHLNLMPYEAADQMEKDLAEELRRAGTALSAVPPKNKKRGIIYVTPINMPPLRGLGSSPAWISPPTKHFAMASSLTKWAIR